METLPSPVESLNVVGTSRRIFVKGVGLIASSWLLGTLGGCECLLREIEHRPIRRRLRTGSMEVDRDITHYTQAVQAMMSSSSTVQWAAEAAIHGTVAAGFIYCQHGNDHFFDWHRGYLYYFEKICQQLIGDKHFGLPYWNWNQDPGIPAPFLDMSSVLYMPRGRTSMSGSSAITTAALDPIFGDGNFYTFSSQLEGTPHNTVHTYIGGGDTFATGGSASDPLFWAHHCMVDYCWYKWNVELGNDNTNDSAWTDTVNSHYVDAAGNPATATAAVTTLMPFLSYQYESSAIGSNPAQPRRRKAELKIVEQRVREGADIRLTISQRVHLADRVAIAIARPISFSAVSREQIDALLGTSLARENIFASIDYAQLPATSDFAVRVFVNLPSASRNTPIEDVHYAGSFAFFGTASSSISPETAGGHSHQPKFLVNLTATIQRLKQHGEWNRGGGLSVQLVAAPFAGNFERENTEVVLTSVDIITTPVIVKSIRQ
jgi:tyrosinase